MAERGSVFFRIDRSKALDEELGYERYSFPPVRFSHGMRLRDASIGGELNFHGAQFWGTSDLSCLQVRGNVYFKDPEKQTTHPCSFSNKALWLVNETSHDQVSFLHGEVPENIRLHKLPGRNDVRVLCEVPEASVPFTELAFQQNERKVKFWQQELIGRLTLAGARLGGSVFFDDAKFEVPLDLEDCRIGAALSFAGSMPAAIDLSDCDYKRLPIEDINDIENPYKQITSLLKKPPSQPFLRQPWLQLEATLRRMGKIEDADAVYLARRREEHERLRLVAKPVDRLWDLLSKYGTAPHRLAAIGVLVMLLSACLFGVGEFGTEAEMNRRIARGTQEDVSAEATPRQEMMTSCWGRLNASCWATAAAISVYQFSPVKLPIGEEYRPGGWAAGWAALERVIGWVIVPLLVGTLAGQLNRKAEPKEIEAGDE